MQEALQRGGVGGLRGGLQARVKAVCHKASHELAACPVAVYHCENGPHAAARLADKGHSLHAAGRGPRESRVQMHDTGVLVGDRTPGWVEPGRVQAAGPKSLVSALGCFRCHA